MKGNCKHNLGWCSIQTQHIFTDRKYNVTIGFEKKSKWGSKVTSECNLSCGAKRNMYFDKTGKFVKFGNIIPNLEKPCFCNGHKVLTPICKECNDANCVEDEK